MGFVKYTVAHHCMFSIGVDYNETSKMNPLQSILKKFDEDDFIVMKLDIDSPGIELNLANQLLEDKEGVYHKLIDQFYFEHHVPMAEMFQYWRDNTLGTMQASFEFFHALRKKGIAAHFWI